MARYMEVSRTLSASSAVKATAQASVVRRRAHTVTLLLEAFGTRFMPPVLHAGLRKILNFYRLAGFGCLAGGLLLCQDRAAVQLLSVGAG